MISEPRGASSRWTLVAGLSLILGGGVPHAWAQARLSLRTSEPASATAPAAAAPVVSDPAKGNPMDSLDDRKPIAVGNLLEFRVLEDLDEEPDPKADPSAQNPLTMNRLQVSDSGEVEHPYFGRVLAKGKTHRQLAEEIKKILERSDGLYYQATVLISLATSGVSRGKVYISGAVSKPGPFDIPVNENMTASKALSSVGVLEERAAINQIKLIRKVPEGARPRSRSSSISTTSARVSPDQIAFWSRKTRSSFRP